MGEQKADWKSIIVGAAVFLVISAVAVTMMALWPEEESTSTPSYAEQAHYAVEEPFDPDSVDWFLDLSPEILETVSLEAVREYMPTAASFSAIRRDGAYEGDYAILDANGAELGLVVLDSDGRISSGRIYDLGFEEAKGIAEGIIADNGIDPELLLLETATIQHASEHVTEYQFCYVPHIGDIPVHNLDHCSIWLNPIDGSTMSFNLSGSFVLPATTPTETLVSKDEAVSLAMDEFSRTMEERYPIMHPHEGISLKLTDPVAFVYVVYNDAENSITPIWRIPLERCFTTVDDGGNTYSFNGTGGICYEVNATTGDVLEAEAW